MAFTETFKIEAVAPFNFDLTAQIFQSGDKQIRTYANGQFTQVLKLNGKLTIVKLASKGTIEQPKITVELKSNSPITLQDRQKAEEAVKFIFNLDFDLSAFYIEVKNEQTMYHITQQLYGLKNPTTATVYEALVDSIVEQQISIKVAHTIEERLIKKFGEILTLDDESFYAYPTPQNIVCASLEGIRNCGLSQRKAEYIQEAAKLIVNGKLDLEQLKSCKEAPRKSSLNSMK